MSSGCSHDVATIYPRYFTKLGYFSALEQKSLKDLAQNCFKQCFDGPFKHVHYFIYLKLRNPGQTAELYADDSSLTQVSKLLKNKVKKCSASQHQGGCRRGPGYKVYYFSISFISD